MDYWLEGFDAADKRINRTFKDRVAAIAAAEAHCRKPYSYIAVWSREDDGKTERVFFKQKARS